MSTARAARRRIERLAPAVQRLYDADLRFFERHPERVFRYRLAGVAEVQQQALMRPDRVERAGLRMHVLVRKVPKARFRLYVLAREGTDVDLPETELAAIWSDWAPPGSEIALAVAVLNEGDGA